MTVHVTVEDEPLDGLGPDAIMQELADAIEDAARRHMAEHPDRFASTEPTIV